MVTLKRFCIVWNLLYGNLGDPKKALIGLKDSEEDAARIILQQSRNEKSAHLCDRRGEKKHIWGTLSVGKVINGL